MPQNIRQKKDVHIRVRLRRIDDLPNIDSILRHTSARTKNRAVQYSIRFFCDLWRFVQQGQKIIVVHAEDGYQITIGMPSPTKPKITEDKKKETIRYTQPTKVLKIRLEPEEAEAIDILIEDDVWGPRTQLICKMLATYACIVEYVADGWALYAEKSKTDRLPIAIPGVHLLPPKPVSMGKVHQLFPQRRKT